MENYKLQIVKFGALRAQDYESGLTRGVRPLFSSLRERASAHEGKRGGEGACFSCLFN